MNPRATWRAAPSWSSNASPATTSSRAAAPSWRSASRHLPASSGWRQAVADTDRRFGVSILGTQWRKRLPGVEEDSVASVELRGLTKRYGGVAVVDDVSPTIEHGRLVCLLGPSGCGKTTTLRLIAGFIEPSAGGVPVGHRLLLFPRPPHPAAPRDKSHNFPNYPPCPQLTWGENT